MAEKKLWALWWLVFPAFFLVLNVCLQLYATPTFNRGLLMENGPYEILQAFVVTGAFVLSALTLSMALRTKNRNLIVWCALMTLGTFYISGEEISWGQQIFQWSTPESWMAVNDHQETNLHNTTQWLDQKPKALLEIGILFGGILIPIYRKYRRSAFLDKIAIVLPPDYLWVSAATLWFFKAMKGLDQHFHFMDLTRSSEINELCIYYFLLLYAIVFRWRLKKLPENQAK